MSRLLFHFEDCGLLQEAEAQSELRGLPNTAETEGGRECLGYFNTVGTTGAF